MNHSLAFDRVEEGRDGELLAVLVTDDGASIVVPRGLLPKDAQPGETLAMTLARDPSATAKAAKSTEAIRGDLKKTDPGGTIKL